MGIQYHAPNDFGELVSLMGQQDTMLIAGGTSVVPLLKQGLLHPANIVWVGRVRGMDAIRETSQGLTIGGATPLKAVARSDLVRRLAPAVAKAAQSVGNPRVRSVATVAGAIAHADPRQDLPPALLATDARVVVADSVGSKEIALRQGFFAGFMMTALQPGNVIREVLIPTANSVQEYIRFTPSSPDDYPTMSIAVSLHETTVEPMIAIGLGGLADTPLHLQQPAFASSDGDSLRGLINEVRSKVDPIDDELGSADYKRWVAGVWAERVVGDLLNRQRHQAER